MRALSAVNSVSLAVQRTGDFLFKPFNWGTYLKLCLVAIVTEGIGSNSRFHSSAHNGGKSSGHSPMICSQLCSHPGWIAAIIVFALVAIVVGFVLAYLVTRLRFAYFHCLIHNTKLIRTGWQIYQPHAARFFGMNVVVGVCYLLLLALISIPFVAGFWHLFHDIPPGGHPNIGLMISLILPLIPILFLLVLFGVVIDVILRDWMLPHYALENASAGEAWDRVWAHIKLEKREFFVYTLLRLILPFVAMIALFVVLIIPGIMLAGSLAAIGYGIHSAFADATGASVFVGNALIALFGTIAFGFALLIGICLGGPVSTGVREYALVFYGGRYPALGNILYPPTAAETGTPGIA